MQRRSSIVCQCHDSIGFGMQNHRKKSAPADLEVDDGENDGERAAQDANHHCWRHGCHMICELRLHLPGKRNLIRDGNLKLLVGTCCTRENCSSKST